MPPVSAPRRKAPSSGGPRFARPGSGNRPRPRSGASPGAGPGTDKAEHEILFQTYFKSVGPRTYAAQIKKASNENQYLVLTEGRRDEKTGEVRKARLFVYSEDFTAFFRMLQETAQHLRANPVPEEVKQRRARFWAKKESGKESGRSPEPATPPAPGSAASAPVKSPAAALVKFPAAAPAKPPAAAPSRPLRAR
jgi:hypothetical protein